MDNIETLAQWVGESRNIVAFTGAGCSTESGIPDFRSVDGLYRQTFDDPPETILSHSFFLEHPESFYRFYREKLLPLDAAPNAAHKKLAQWEQEGRLRAVVTQNIDGLHQKAGCRKVYELHGSVYRNHCMQCRRAFGPETVRDSVPLPLCDRCGGLIKPDVVLYEEALDQGVLQGAVEAIMNADMLIVGGTSLVVWPAAALVDYYRGDRLVLINREPTRVSGRADLVITDSIGVVLGGGQS